MIDIGKNLKDLLKELIRAAACCFVAYLIFKAGR